MSRFPAELTITLTDGRTVTEYFNQTEMAQFTRRRMVARLGDGLPLIVYDGERVEIPAKRVASVQVIERHLVPA